MFLPWREMYLSPRFLTSAFEIGRSIETIFDHPIFEFPYNQVRIRAFSPGVFVSEFLNQLGDQIEVAGSTISLLFFGLRNHNSPLKALSRIEGRSASNSAAVRLARG